MKLPGGSNAVVDIAKLRDYCLSATHPRGRHKARVFASSLGLTYADADWLRNELLAARYKVMLLRATATNMECDTRSISNWYETKGERGCVVHGLFSDLSRFRG